MIDPLRPYWPTNRSIAGLLIRSFCVLAAALAVGSGASRSFAFLVVLLAATAQASFLVFEWMELKRASRSLLAAGIVGVLFLSLVVALVIESRSVLVSSVR
jgi:heme/copper-type cytochrome/quinol oxidase subunit 4